MNLFGPLKISDDQYILPLPSHGNDDNVKVSYFNTYAPNVFEFSANIVVIEALTTGFCGGGFVIVKKKNDALQETVKIYNPDGPDVTVNF